MANEHRTRSTIQSPPAITQPFPPNKSPQTSFCSPGTKPSSRGKCGKPRVWLGQAIAQVSFLAITGIKANVILGFSISTIYQFSRICLKLNNCQNFSHFHHTCSLSMRRHSLTKMYRFNAFQLQFSLFQTLEQNSSQQHHSLSQMCVNLLCF